jgi:acetyl-CoA carboxylase biotin carboxyl carrier protein
LNEAKLKQLLKIFEESDVEELELQHSFWSGTKIRISRRSRPQIAYQPEVPPPSSSSGESTFPPASSEEPETVPEDDGLHAITSPMVGTFFIASSPESTPFVRQGDRIEKGQTICIIEAMKIMNEIPSDVEGEVVALLVDSGEPVEFGQPLLKIRPSS